MSGATKIKPCLAANCWAPALVTKFCSVHVSPDSQKTTGTLAEISNIQS